MTSLSKSDKKCAYLFVYGTLMVGHTNHHLLEEADTACFGDAFTLVSKWDLYHTNGFPIANPTKKGSRIVGELYSVSTETLKKLDELERGFTREEVVVLDEYCEALKAWVYFMDDNNLQALAERQAIWPALAQGADYIYWDPTEG